MGCGQVRSTPCHLAALAHDRLETDPTFTIPPFDPSFYTGLPLEAGIGQLLDGSKRLSVRSSVETGGIWRRGGIAPKDNTGGGKHLSSSQMGRGTVATNVVRVKQARSTESTPGIRKSDHRTTSEIGPALALEAPGRVAKITPALKAHSIPNQPPSKGKS